MKYIFFFACCLLLLHFGMAQDVDGRWVGILKPQENLQMRVVFNIRKAPAGYTATMDMPDAGSKNIRVTSVSFRGAVLTLDIPNLKVHYEGTVSKDTITGVLKQRTYTFPLTLSKFTELEQAQQRPQTPKPPYPYVSEDVSFKNLSAKITLSGTLTLPKKDGLFPTLILISGNGPQDRNEEFFGHLPFLVLSDFLTRNGFAVLRFDDRGVGQSTGNFNEATTQDFAADTEAALAYLATRPEVDKARIALVGHSEGATVAAMLATRQPIHALVLLAGPGLPGDDLLIMQQEALGKAAKVPDHILKHGTQVSRQLYSIIKRTENLNTLRFEVSKFIERSMAENPMSLPKSVDKAVLIKSQVRQLTTPWMQFFINYDPRTALQNVKCPVLAISGQLDKQVSPQENLNAIKTTLRAAGNTNVTAEVLPGLNHFFQESKTGLPNEYAQLSQTFSPVAMEKILAWLKLHNL